VTSGEVTGTIYTLKAIVPPPVVTPPTPTQTPTVTTTSNNFGTTGGGNPPASSSGSVAPFSTSGSVTPAGQVLGAATFHFTIELYFGMANNDVKQLQIRLNSDDNAGLVVDGIFGNFTKAAVMKWQTLHHLTADGIVGPKTIAVLNG
jgi:peptidoglycan hydrolase-like protein with peptidoglycan-binding domain